MFDKLIDIILGALDRISPMTVIRDFEEATVLRFGVFNRALKPGFHGTWPLIEEVHRDTVVIRVVTLSTQSLTTRDDVDVTLSAVVVAKIGNIRKATLEVQDADDALRSACEGVIGSLVETKNWQDVKTLDFLAEAKGACHQAALDYGFRITEFYFNNKSRTESLRLFGLEDIQIGGGRE